MSSENPDQLTDSPENLLKMQNLNRKPELKSFAERPASSWPCEVLMSS
jgi:hypothetical protein